MRWMIMVLALLAGFASAQDRDGNDTPGEWQVTYQKPYGLWDVFCDARDDEERCYIRYVEVYAPRPDFGAMFVFVTPDGIDFGMEAGTLFGETGPRIELDGAQVWAANGLGCRTGVSCNLTGNAATAFLDAARNGGTLRMTFTDRQGREQDLAWGLSRFADAFADWQNQSTARGLPAAVN